MGKRDRGEVRMRWHAGISSNQLILIQLHAMAKKNQKIATKKYLHFK